MKAKKEIKITYLFVVIVVVVLFFLFVCYGCFFTFHILFNVCLFFVRAEVYYFVCIQVIDQ